MECNDLRLAEPGTAGNRLRYPSRVPGSLRGPEPAEALELQRFAQMPVHGSFHCSNVPQDMCTTHFQENKFRHVETAGAMQHVL